MDEFQLTFDQLIAEDPVIKAIGRALRDGPGRSLDEAIRDVAELEIPTERLDAARNRIEACIDDVRQAEVPRAVVAGNIESWYPGPRKEDRNWASLTTLLGDGGWSSDALADLDDSSTKVVANLANPHGESTFNCRGLVLGYVQSGKTTNFTAVIAKAADAGYRFFIVLSGIHEALRHQTQSRLDAQLVYPLPGLWHALTREGDFRATTSVDALLSTSDQRVLAVVKKNGSRLRALSRWLQGARPELLARCPILIIDDEADQASVNTAKPDRSPTAINRLIRNLVNEVPKAVYVGYTATPFANVLIDPEDYDDLYPRDFIVDLPRPRFYVGPEAIFGRDPLEFDPDGSEADDGQDFVRSVPVEELPDIRPLGAAARHDFTPVVTPSLDRALRYFLMSTAARRIRGVGNRHATALIHTSQHVDVHERTAAVVRAHLGKLGTRLSSDDPQLLTELEAQWNDESSRVPSSDFGLELISWGHVVAELHDVASRVSVVTDNSRTPKDQRLNFDDADPQIVVAVGGNTLSRGLTLEGLSVSFFVRTASAYDTLLQMGRWFGYRNGYVDLTRLWLTDDMREWFHHLATVEQEIRWDIERYETEHVKPSELGVRIRTHPKLAITSAAKMQAARPAEISYSGRRIQTILFNHRDPDWLLGNLKAGRDLVRHIPSTSLRSVRPGITICGPVPTEDLLDFLRGYRFHPNSRDLDGELISAYVQGRMADGELTRFTVAVMGRASVSDSLGGVDLGLAAPVGCINRARMATGNPDYADIKALMGQADRVIDLDITTSDFASVRTLGEVAKLRNPVAEGGRGDGTGLLLLYPVSKDSVPVRGRTRQPLEAVEHVLGVGMVFPVTKSGSAAIDYLTANVDSLPSDVDAPDDADLPSDEVEGEA